MSRPSPFSCRGGFDPDGPRGHRAANAFVTEHYPYWDLACRKHDETNGQESYYGFLDNPPGSGRRFGIWVPMDWIPARGATLPARATIQTRPERPTAPAETVSGAASHPTCPEASDPLSEPLEGEEPYPF